MLENKAAQQVISDENPPGITSRQRRWHKRMHGFIAVIFKDL